MTMYINAMYLKKAGKLKDNKIVLTVMSNLGEYEILSHELETFNPDLATKPRVLAITKCDMLDDELIEQLRPELPAGIEAVFISSVAQQGLTELKDVLWRTINDEHNRLPDDAARRDLDEHHRVKEEDDFIFAAAPVEKEAEEAGGYMVVDEEQEWDDEYWADHYESEDDKFQIVNDDIPEEEDDKA